MVKTVRVSMLGSVYVADDEMGVILKLMGFILKRVMF